MTAEARATIIHFTGPLQFGGVERWLERTLAAGQLRAPRVKHVFVVNELGGKLEGRFLALGAQVRCAGRFSNFPRYIWRTMAALREARRPDRQLQLHIHTEPFAWLAIAAGLLAGERRFIVHSHNDRIRAGVLSVAWWSLQLSRFLAMASGAKALACSASARPLMFPLLREDECAYVPYCVSQEALRGPLRPPGTSPRPVLRIGSVGRLSFQKNHRFLLPVAECLRELGVPFSLRIIGDGTLAAELTHEIRQRRLEDVVSVEAGRDDIVELLRTSFDVLVLPSRWEGFPVILLECQAVALPVLCSNTVGGEIDVVDGLIERLAIEPGSVRPWAEALARLARHPRVVDPLHCRQKINERFSPDAAWTLLARHYGVTSDERSSI